MGLGFGSFLGALRILGGGGVFEPPLNPSRYATVHRYIGAPHIVIAIMSYRAGQMRPGFRTQWFAVHIRNLSQYTTVRDVLISGQLGAWM